MPEENPHDDELIKALANAIAYGGMGSYGVPMMPKEEAADLLDALRKWIAAELAKAKQPK